MEEDIQAAARQNDGADLQRLLPIQRRALTTLLQCRSIYATWKCNNNNNEF